jgi:hypothetical protein
MTPPVEYIVCGFSVLHQTHDRISYTGFVERGTRNIVHHVLYVAVAFLWAGPNKQKTNFLQFIEWLIHKVFVWLHAKGIAHLGIQIYMETSCHTCFSDESGRI